MSEIIKDRRKKLAFAALREHKRTWEAGEGERFRALNKKGIGDRAAVEAVMSDLKVSRSLPKIQRDNFFSMYQKFVDDSWQQRSLSGNGIIIRELVNKWKESGKGRQRVCSLVCKVTWYIHPLHWTFYDTLSRSALRISDGDKAVVDFYNKLEELEFISLCDALRDPVKSYDPRLWPERAVDKLLWIVGDSLRTEKELPAIPSNLSRHEEEFCDLLSSSKLMFHLEQLSLP